MEQDTINQIVARCSRFPEVEAIGLVGSRAIQDRDADDWDLYAFTSTAAYPREEERVKSWSEPESPLNPEKIQVSRMCDRFDGPPHIGIDYFPKTEIDERILRIVRDGVVSRTHTAWYTLGECSEAVCAEIKACVPLWDTDGIISGWKELLSPYPRQFKTNVLYWVLFEARYRLRDMRRASEIGDVALMHMSLSELCFCLLRIVFAANEEYFRGVKRAMRMARRFSILPEKWDTEMQCLLGTSLSAGNLEEVYVRAKLLTKDLAEECTPQGKEEERMVDRALSDWPDIDPL